jgi:hypothetical protein
MCLHVCLAILLKIEMADLKEQHARVCVCARAGVKFCIHLEKKNCSWNCHWAQGRLLRIIPWVKQVDEWFNRFKRGEMSVEDQLRCGRPSMSRTEENVVNAHDAAIADRHRTIDEMSERTGVCHGVYATAF